jgi:hypothetical protein
MGFKLMRVSLICSIAFLIAAGLLAEILADTPVGYLGYLLTPGIWIVYDGFDVNNHDLLPLVAALLLDILVYWIAFALLLGLSWKTRRGKMAQAGQR